MNRNHWIAALTCGLEAAVALYAVIRVVQAVVGHEANPATVMQSIHAGYFWRAWIAAYGGGFVALFIAIVSRHTHRVVHGATRALPFAGALLVLQALFVP